MEIITGDPPIPERPVAGHKGTFGHVLIAAGSVGMSGAAALAGLGALRSGAGLVRLAVPQSLVGVVAAIEPSYLVLPLPEDNGGRTSGNAGSELSRAATVATAMAIGPGWGHSVELEGLATSLFETLDCPLVVDADGLNLLATAGTLATGGPPAAGRVLTPHPGEMARLMETDVLSVQADREGMAVDLASRSCAVVVLKGAGTVITDGVRVVINTTGNSGLATGGSGDVLTGLVAGLLARGMDPFAAAWLGVHLHGLAADLAVVQLGESGLIASDLPDWIPAAWIELEECRGGADDPGEN
ncbi:MAG: NAD(P)H-hydrate dehydratase [Planctomycetota bacterium]|nr:NAD(P)H-hydrate dehydratase [Planctomycetota bacterium]